MSLAIVSGALANKPFNGGNAWTRLSWVLGLKRLGFDVIFLEQIRTANCVNQEGTGASFGESVNRDYFRNVMTQFGLSGASALIHEDDLVSEGIPLSKLQALAREASLLVNISGHLTLEEIQRPIHCKVYFDDDPGYTQLWQAMGSSGARLDHHDFFYTIGANVGSPSCEIPTGTVEWRHVWPPVVLAEWPDTSTGQFTGFTTVASWRGAYSSVQYKGRTFGQKAHEFRKFIELPARCPASFEIALQIHPGDQKDLNALRENGWRIVDPFSVTHSPDAFRSYLQTSGAEFSVAQGMYVETQCGWFSDRTIRYLASGRPALVQNTGFDSHLPTGKGLLGFRTIEEAMDGVDRIVRDYSRHCQEARKLAEAHFDSDLLLRRMMKEIGVSHG